MSAIVCKLSREMGRQPRAAPEGEDPRLLAGPWKARRHAAAAEEDRLSSFLNDIS